MVTNLPAAHAARSALACAVLALGGLAPLTAAAQSLQAPPMRPGQPDVLVPHAPEQAAPAFDPLRFRAAYAAAGSPKVVLFWNRELTDRLVADQVELSRDSTWEQETRSRQQTERQGERVTEKRNTVEPTGGREGPADERDARMRSAYVGALLGSGVQLLDRNLILRNQGLRDKTVSDPQQVEAAALQAGAGWLLEVVLTPATQSLDGWVLHSRLKRVADGALLADSLYDGSMASAASPSAPSERRYVADPIKGGYRVAPPAVAAGSSDQRLAAGAAEAVLQAWSMSPR